MSQMYAELLTLVTTRDENHAWAKTILDEKLASIGSMPSELSESFCVGVAFSAARMWDESQCRSRSVELLSAIAPHSTERVALAFGSVFWATDDFADDENTLRLLKLVDENPSVLNAESAADLIGHLAKLCKFQQRAVLDVTKVIVRNYGKEAAGISSAFGLVRHKPCPGASERPLTWQILPIPRERTSEPSRRNRTRNFV